MATDGSPPPADGNGSLPPVRGAEEACRGLRTFSCAEIAACPAACDAQQILKYHRNSLEDACKWQAEDHAMQVDSPSSRREDASMVVKSALKVHIIPIG